MTMLLSERSQIFNRADAYAVSEYVNQHVGNHCIRLPPRGRPKASISHRTFASLDLCRISYGAPVQVMSEALETIYHLQIFLQGHCRSLTDGEEHLYGPGEILLINPDDPVDLTYSSDCEKFIVKLPVRLLESTCIEQQWQLPARGIRFTSGQTDISMKDGVLQLLSLICLEAENGAAMEVKSLYERIFANKILSLVHNNVSRISPDKEAGGFEAVRQYIEKHLREDIPIEQLMAIARVSERSLYLLFERHIGMPPKDYIRQRKLDRVHAELQSSKAVSVTRVALDNGFIHLGRFSDLYRRQFGELPSQTWRRQRSHHTMGG